MYTQCKCVDTVDLKAVDTTCILVITQNNYWHKTLPGDE